MEEAQSFILPGRWDLGQECINYSQHQQHCCIRYGLVIHRILFDEVFSLARIFITVIGLLLLLFPFYKLNSQGFPQSILIIVGILLFERLMSSAALNVCCFCCFFCIIYVYR